MQVGTISRLSAILVIALALAAFGVGGLVAPPLTSLWWGAPRTIAEHERDADVPAKRDAVLTIERGQSKLRDARAEQRVAQLKEPSVDYAKRATAITAIDRELNNQISRLQDARVELAQATRSARRAEARARTERQWQQRLARAAAAALTLLALALAVIGLQSVVQRGVVLVGAAVGLVALLLADGLGIAAVLALAAIVVAFVVRGAARATA